MVFTQYPVTTVPRSKQVLGSPTTQIPSWDPSAETAWPVLWRRKTHGLPTNNENFRTIKPCFWGISAYPPSFPFHSRYIGLMVGTSALAMKHHPIPGWLQPILQWKDIERLGYNKIPKDQQPNGHQAMMFLRYLRKWTSPGSQAALHGTVWRPLFDYARVGVKRRQMRTGKAASTDRLAILQ